MDGKLRQLLEEHEVGSESALHPTHLQMLYNSQNSSFAVLANIAPFLCVLGTVLEAVDRMVRRRNRGCPVPTGVHCVCSPRLPPGHLEGPSLGELRK